MGDSHVQLKNLQQLHQTQISEEGFQQHVESITCSFEG